MKHLRAFFYFVIIVLTTILIQMYFALPAYPAYIISDSRNKIIIEGKVETGDAARFLFALGKLDSQYVDNGIVEIIIDTEGGSADAMVNMVYILSRWSDEHNCLIKTVIYKKAYSAGGVLFLMGDIRLMGDEAVFMAHDVSFQNAKGEVFTLEEAEGVVPDFQLKEAKLSNKLIYKLFKRTRAPVKFIKDAKFIFVDEAIKYGIATGRVKLNF